MSIQKSIQSLWIFTLWGTVFQINVHMFYSYRHMYTVYKHMCIYNLSCQSTRLKSSRVFASWSFVYSDWKALLKIPCYWTDLKHIEGQRRETIQRNDYANTSTQLLSAVHQAAASKAKISRPTWKARPSLLSQFVSAHPGISHHLYGRCCGLTTLWGKWQRGKSQAQHSDPKSSNGTVRCKQESMHVQNHMGFKPEPPRWNNLSECRRTGFRIVEYMFLKVITVPLQKGQKTLHSKICHFTHCS